MKINDYVNYMTPPYCFTLMSLDQKVELELVVIYVCILLCKPTHFSRFWKR